MSETHRKALLEKANSLPLSPGVYIMKGKDDRVIYVGKSRKLKNRVSQYFQNGEKSIKTARMVIMMMGQQHSVNPIEGKLQHLHPEVGTAVDKQSAAGMLDKRRRTQTGIARVGRTTNLAPATKFRNTGRSTCT